MAATAASAMAAAEAESVLVYLNTAAALRTDPRTQGAVPLAADTVAEASRSGVLPCVLVNAMVPGTIDEQMVSLAGFLAGAAKLGCELGDVTEEALANAGSDVWLGIYCQLVKVVAKSRLKVRSEAAATAADAATSCVLCGRTFAASDVVFVAKGKRHLCSTCVSSVAVAVALLGAAGGAPAPAPSAAAPAPASAPAAATPPTPATTSASSAARPPVRKATGSVTEVEDEIFGNFERGKKPPPRSGSDNKLGKKTEAAAEADDAAPPAAPADAAPARAPPAAVPEPAEPAHPSVPAALAEDVDVSTTEILGLPAAPEPRHPRATPSAVAVAAAAADAAAKRTSASAATPGRTRTPVAPLQPKASEDEDLIFGAFDATRPRARRKPAPTTPTAAGNSTDPASDGGDGAAPAAAALAPPSVAPTASSSGSVATSDASEGADAGALAAAAAAAVTGTAAPTRSRPGSGQSTPRTSSLSTPASTTGPAPGTLLKAPLPPAATAALTSAPAPAGPPAVADPAAPASGNSAVPPLITNPAVAAAIVRATTTVYANEANIVRRQQELAILLEDLESTLNTAAGTASEIVISTLREKEVALLIEWNHLMAEKDRLLRQSHGLRVAVPGAPGPAAAADAPKPGPSLMSPRRGR